MAVFLPKGTRDFLPEQMLARQQVIDTIRTVFERHGFDPLETPAFERLETLTGKYGEETDKLMFKIHARGRNAKPGECDLGLRYDLTVPLARVVAMNPQLRMPFKRYQIQPVWRAERNQKGRFREFYQCDVDVMGSTDTLCEAECMAVVTDALGALGFTDYTVKLNDRRILADFAQMAGATDARQELSALIAIDKLDKVGREGVEKELAERGLDPAGLAPLWALEGQLDDGAATLDRLDALLTARGRAGVATLREVMADADAAGVDMPRIQVDPFLARGADYYTGPVFEVHSPTAGVGSLAGGGRYDGLVAAFSGRDVPAVGVSLGLERILVVMEERGMLSARATAADVFVTVFDDACRAASIAAARALRDAGVKTDLFLKQTKLGKQLKHADLMGFPFVVIVGPDEAAKGLLQLKDMRSGTSTTDTVEAIAAVVLEAVGSAKS